jgi:hypothetical protein
VYCIQENYCVGQYNSLSAIPLTAGPEMAKAASYQVGNKTNLFTWCCRPFKQCCGSGSAWIRNFLSDPDPELEVSDPDLGQCLKLDGKRHKNHQKMNYFIRYKF